MAQQRYSVQHNRPARFAGLVLALALAVAQWIGLAHEVDSHALGGSDVCDQCLLWHAGKAALPPALRTVPHQPPQLSPPDAPQRDLTTAFSAVRLPRGPPALLS